MLRTFSGLFIGIFGLAAGCGNVTPTGGGTMDLTGMPTDMGVVSDQAGPLGPDMVTVLPAPTNCDTATIITGTQAYTTLIGPTGLRCQAGCHNITVKPVFSTRATFMAATINQPSSSVLPYVVPNMPDRSYLLYKLRGLQAMVRNGGGLQMPRNGTPLTDVEYCQIYDWVLHGAPVN